MNGLFWAIRARTREVIEEIAVRKHAMARSSWQTDAALADLVASAAALAEEARR